MAVSIGHEDLRLWGEREIQGTYIVYDYPLSTEPIVSAILGMDDAISPTELEARFKLYSQIPMYDIVHAIEDTCRHYNLDAKRCLSNVGLTRSISQYHAYRVDSGGWGCKICGIVFPTKELAKKHLTAIHNIRKPLLAPECMVFVHATSIVELMRDTMFTEDMEYLRAIVSQGAGDMENEERASLPYIPHSRPEYSRMIERLHKYGTYILRYRHLRAIDRGINFNIDQIVRKCGLNLLDTIILLNAIAEYTFDGHTSHPITLSRMKRLSRMEIKHPFHTGYLPSEIKEYCRKSKTLLHTGLIEIDDEKGVLMRPEAFRKRVLAGKGLPHQEEYIFILQEPEITLDDVVLEGHIKKKLEIAINAWRNIAKRTEKNRKMGKYGRGMVILLSGPPGTGKTYTAYAIAGTLGLKVMEASIPDIFNALVGETEKNLKRLFKLAEENNALLLIDEADALVSMRGRIRNAVDRLLNAEINVFLQELERFNGIVVLTTNLNPNLDPALRRRANLKITYKAPSAALRESLWRHLIPRDVELAKDVSFKELAKRWNFTGGQIKNAIDNAIMIAEERYNGMGRIELTQKDLMAGANIELEGENKGENDGRIYIQ